MKPILIITGPTASGKTAFSESIIHNLNNKAEIINADMGQFYKPLTIGTAKPTNWQSLPFPCHLFDIVDTPTHVNAAAFCSDVSSLVDDIVQRGNTPIIVGGSLYYLRALFFPPATYVDQSNDMKPEIDFDQETATLWYILNAIDQERAQAIHTNDRYRIIRALTIWQKTGRKPSSFEPKFRMPFPNRTIIVDITPQAETLRQRIQTRTSQMFEQGWIDEVKALQETDWEPFLKEKGLIGYPELFAWLKKGASEKTLIDVEKIITQKTYQYARKQLIFLRMFKKSLEHTHENLSMFSFHEGNDQAVRDCLSLL